VDLRQWSWSVVDIQQAADGYLWLTTSTGVFRFDGVRFQSVEEPPTGPFTIARFTQCFLSSSEASGSRRERQDFCSGKLDA